MLSLVFLILGLIFNPPPPPELPTTATESVADASVTSNGVITGD